MRLLVTRPEPDAMRTAATLRARGHDVILAPLTTIEPFADSEFGDGPWSGLLVTSANAVRALATHPRAADLASLPVFAVGKRTAEAARNAGFVDVVSADGNVEDLTELAAARAGGTGARLIYLAGADRAGDLAGALAMRGIAVTTVTIYRAAAATRFPPIAHDALVNGQVDGVLHFSRRGADIYLQCAEAGDIFAQALAPRHYCLSRNVSEPLSAAGAAIVAVAERPDEVALIALLGL
jgi:uroporphyrinogen-III synthase